MFFKLELLLLYNLCSRFRCREKKKEKSKHSFTLRARKKFRVYIPNYYIIYVKISFSILLLIRFST